MKEILRIAPSEIEKKSFEIITKNWETDSRIRIRRR